MTAAEAQRIADLLVTTEDTEDELDWVDGPSTYKITKVRVGEAFIDEYPRGHRWIEKRVERLKAAIVRRLTGQG